VFVVNHQIVKPDDFEGADPFVNGIKEVFTPHGYLFGNIPQSTPAARPWPAPSKVMLPAPPETCRMLAATKQGRVLRHTLAH